MSDYMFMLESHLSPEQNQVIALVTAAAEHAGVTAFLTGGAMRDMMAGFPIRNLDFSVEGNALKLASALAAKKVARVKSQDDVRKAATVQFPSGVSVEIAMAQETRYGKPGTKPKVVPATIYEDLRGRDFTINSIALSLNPASRGLILDPANGLGDLERRDLRANNNYTLYDDPSRILRMWRLQARMSLTIEDRTMSQYRNVREAKLERKISIRHLRDELRRMADEPNPGTLLETLDREGLLELFSESLCGSKFNQAGFTKFQHALQSIPFGIPFPMERVGLFLYVLTGKLNSREKTSVIQHLGISKADVESWQKLESKSKKLEQIIKSPKLKKASLIYRALLPAAGEQILFLYMFSAHRLVHDRIKNHLQKYLVTAHEIPDRDLAHTGLEPGTPKFIKAKEDLINAHLDGRIRKPAPEEPPPPGGPQGGRPMGRPAGRPAGRPPGRPAGRTATARS